MSKLMLAIAAVFTALICNTANALDTDKMTCRNGIVYEGVTMSEVVKKCGPPSYTKSHKERRTDKDAEITVLVDNWNYNFGPKAVMYDIRFENGRVNKIESNKAGY